ncbi:Sulfotransferase 1A4 [Amphibalanus amphitrite]|uniref:Sulfotransferase 1A4 n=1 Tax=Amphibalanus amphitrite TaxID=1232801 RepID=A0A6A4WZ55_AMPAM|nr:Sulfotransferase 1A4 [Amphibalanus amphitrite]
MDTVDTAVDTVDTAVDTMDTAVDTADTAVDTADTAVDTADTAVDTADTAVDIPTDTAPMSDMVDTADTDTKNTYKTIERGGWSAPAADCSQDLPQMRAGQRRVLYSLFGVVEHSGRLTSGHYTAYVRVRRRHDQLIVNPARLTTLVTDAFAVACERARQRAEQTRPETTDGPSPVGCEMVWLIANDLDYEGAKTPFNPDRWSFLDITGVLDKDQMKKIAPPASEDGATEGPPSIAGDPNRPSPRFVKSHLPFSLNNPRLLDVCKVVYVARNPKDLCVSFYHHMRLIRFHDFLGDFELFVDYFMKDLTMESPYIEHMIEAWNLRHHPNLCFLFYEDMKKDMKTEIRKVAKFLGKDFTDEQVDMLAEHLHFDNFKNNPWVNAEHLKPLGLMYTDRGNFIRKGKTGDWKNYFTPEMNEKFDKWVAEKLKGTDLTFVQELEEQD